MAGETRANGADGPHPVAVVEEGTTNKEETPTPHSSDNVTSQDNENQAPSSIIDSETKDNRAENVHRIPHGDGTPHGPAPSGALEDHVQSKANPLAAGHKAPQQKPHHHSGDLKVALAEHKKKLKENLKDAPPGGFDPTPLPDAPPGFTVRFIFHRASNLPAADLKTQSSDPFVHATLKAPVPKRHSEDPDLYRRTRTMRRTTEPVWDEQWIVANVPAAGFTLKCRIYDEDYPDSDDRLGNVTIKVNHVSEDWAGIPPPGREFKAKKRMGSKRAYFFKAITSRFDPHVDMTPSLWVSMQVIGRSNPPHAQMYTIGPSIYFKHFSPTIGRLTGTKVNKDNQDDLRQEHSEEEPDPKKMQKYDFQSNEMHLSGPVPSELYHRYVEFRPSIALMFAGKGLRGRILNKALHKQHRRVYNFSPTTEAGTFAPCSEEASQQFLRLAHFDEGGRIFTYVLTLDGMFRFTETGSEFSIDMLSKHTMHSDVATYIACSGEFFIRRLDRPSASSDPEPAENTHPAKDIPGGPPTEPPPDDPAYYQLIIDNDSGTYRPDESVLPLLRDFLEHNFPGLGVVTMHCADERLVSMKKQQVEYKKAAGQRVNMVMNRSPSSSSMSSLSSVDSNLDDLDRSDWAGRAQKTKREQALDFVEDPRRVKAVLSGGHADATRS
ncbi:hypothetical protein BN1708_008932 [Verticillium longisporum]|uniref:C2 domain-containing protein n=1 Tax=Verticillium longisporum TaxID=100787 RepID=A0A0G4N986_VERLO|nr:hypothetical protein BN1708_008932 [Verticillium longisporum]